jgi:hypothetical protein
MDGNSSGEFVSGGYYLTIRRECAEWMPAEFTPESVLSASPCICNFFPDDWTIEWASIDAATRSNKAQVFGIDAISLPAIVAWGTGAISSVFGWMSALYSLDDARDVRMRFLPKEMDVVIFGLGLHESDTDAFLAVAKPPAAQPGQAPIGESGVYECVSARRKVVTGGHHAGFELLSTYTGQITCSWLCNGFPTECARELGVRPNAEGFIPTRADALRCAEYINRNETGAEPGLWLPWLITTYSER